MEYKNQEVLFRKLIKIEAELARLADEVSHIAVSLDPQRSLTTHEAVKPHTCPSCAGLGKLLDDDQFVFDCPACNGTGQV